MEFVIDDQNDTKILKPLRQWKTKPAQIQYTISCSLKKNTGIPTTIADVIVAVEANDQLVWLRVSIAPPPSDIL